MISPGTNGLNEHKSRFLLNSCARNALLWALSQEEYSKVYNFRSIEQMWDTLAITYEGSSEVKCNKLSLLTCKYELFSMEEGEDIQTMFGRFQAIMNELHSLGKHDNYDHIDQILQSVTTYPLAGGRRETHESVFQGRKARRVATNVYSRKTSEKPKCVWSTNFNRERFRSFFLCMRKVLAPHVRHKGRQPLTECANMISICFISPFFRFLCLFMPFCIFCLFVVDKGVSPAPMYSQLR